MTKNEEFYSVRTDGVMSFIVLALRSNFGLSSAYRYCDNCRGLALVFPVNQEAKRFLVHLGYTVHDFKSPHEEEKES